MRIRVQMHQRMGNISPELITLFFNNQCTDEEAEQVSAWLKEHPELVKEYMPEEDWQAFVQNDVLPGAHSERLYARIQERVTPKARVIGWQHIWRVAAAILIITAGIWLFLNQQKPVEQLAQLKQVDNADKLPVTIIRTANSPRKMTLNDGSVVELAANSSIELAQPFAGDKRNIRLKGEATFYVAQEADRPFTVYAGDVATTALGTVFKVTTNAAGDGGRVQLLEGKVMVKRLHAQEVVYLTPGLQCELNEETGLWVKGAIPVQKSADDATVKESVRRIAVDNSYAESAEEVVFRNTQLSQVITVLERIYHVKITCTDKRLNNRKFTGDFRKDQAFDRVLQTIATLNDFSVVHDTDGYRLEIK